MIRRTTSKLALCFTLLTLFVSPLGNAASKQEINARVKETMESFYSHSLAGKQLAKQAAGILVFPKVIKAGFLFGGEYGEGALMVNRKIVDYYATAGASFGFQAGAQFMSQIVLFMDKESLEKFRQSEGWKVGVDGSVAIAETGTGTDIDTQTAKQKIIGFVFSNKGLMFNLSLEGSKFTKIER